MTRAIYLIGAPGVGKTTLLTAYTARYDTGPAERLHKQLWAEPLHLGTTRIGYRLGKTKPPFSGTDTLGMSVNPQAIEWVTTTNLPPLITGEGARLANLAFLTALHQHTNLTLALITADNAQQRRDQRAAITGTTQNPTWVQAATTRAHNLHTQATAAGLHTITIDTTHLTPRQATDYLRNASKEDTRG